MPEVLQRFNYPPVEEWDPSLLPNINCGFAESHKGGDSVLKSQHDGSFGLISAHDLTDEIDRETVSRVAPLIERQLDDSLFDFKNPVVGMHNIFRMAQEEVKDAARLYGPGHKTRIDMSLVKVFVDPNDRQIKVVYGHTGRHSLIHAANNKQPRNVDSGLSDSNNIGIGIPPLADDAPIFDVIPFRSNDKLIIQSRNAAGYDEDKMYNKHELLDAMVRNDPNETAELLIRKNNEYDNRSALVIVAPSDYDEGSKLNWITSRISNARRGEQGTEASGESRNRIRHGIGSLATVGLVGTAFGIIGFSRSRSSRGRISSWRNRNRDRDSEPVVETDSSTRVVSAENAIRSDRDDRESRGWPVGGRRAVRHDHESRRNGKSRKTLVLGVLAVSSVLALRFGFDLGDEVSGWIGDRPDTGIDVWPFGGGDLDDGNRTGWDFNPSNENLNWSDDPVNKAFQDTGGIDVLPPFVDGDWFSLNGFDIDLPNDIGEPGIDIDMDGDVDAPNATVGTPDLNLDAPDVNLPEVKSPDVELPKGNIPDVTPPTPSNPPTPPSTPPAVWAPDTFTIEPGHGLIQEIHDMGHDGAGYDNFTNSDSTRLFNTAQDKFGDNLLNLPNHPGNDVYKVGDDLRISAPGRAHWQSQAIERFFMEEIEKIAKAKK